MKAEAMELRQVLALRLQTWMSQEFCVQEDGSGRRTSMPRQLCEVRSKSESYSHEMANAPKIATLASDLTVRVTQVQNVHQTPGPF